MDKINEDILTRVFEYLPESFLFIAPVSKKWETSYKMSKCGLFTSLESILDSDSNMETAIDNGYNVEEMYLSFDDTDYKLFAFNFYEILDYIIIPCVEEDNSDYYYSSKLISALLCNLNDTYTINMFLEKLEQTGCSLFDPTDDEHYKKNPLHDVIVDRYGYSCGPCHTCWKCESDLGHCTRVGNVFHK